MSNRQIEILKQLGMLIAAIPIVILFTFLFILVFSMIFECVTGFDIIRQLIRPMFGT